MPLEFNLFIFLDLQMGHSTFKVHRIHFENEMPIYEGELMWLMGTRVQGQLPPPPPCL